MSEASFDEIFTTYYQSPSPALAVAALETEAGRDPGWLDRGGRTLPIYFFSAIAREYPPIMREYEALFDRQPTRLVLDVLAQSGDEETRRFVSARLGDGRFHALRDQMRAFVKGRPVGAIDPLVLGRIDPLVKPARTALDLDLLWAEFFVTGNTVPVERIIDVLEWPDVVRGRIERGLRLPSYLRLPGVFLRPAWQLGVPTRVILRLGIDIDPEGRSVVTPEDLDLLCAPQQMSLGGRDDAWSLISPYLSKTKRRTAATKGVASWSLGSNTIDHPPVLETCEAQLATRSDRAKLALLAIAAIARFSRGESRQAAAWAERYLELSPDNVEIRGLLERATRANPSDPSEEPAMSDSIGVSSSGRDAYTRGLLCYQDDEIDRASDAFKEAIGSGDPEWGPKAELQLAMILRERSDVDGAERAYRHVISSSHGPEAGPALANLGALLILRNDPASAKEMLDRAMEVCAPTERAGAAYNLGEMAREQGEIDSAKRLFELAIESSKDTTPQGDDMLDALEAAGRTTDALNRKNQLSENRVGGGAAAAEQLAKLLMKQGNQSGALEAFKQAMAFGQPEVTLRAEAELAGPLLPADEARKLLREAIDSGDPRWGPAASANLGFLLEQEGDLEGAEEAYRQGAESTDPVIGAQAARYLGDLQVQRGDLTAARDSYRRAMESEGEDGIGAAFSLAALLVGSGDKDEAKDIYERLMQVPVPEIQSEAQRELRELEGSSLRRLFRRR